jgi:uncharacterized membrane protein
MNNKAAELAAKHFRRSWETLTERERQIVDAVVARAHVSRPIHREMEEGLTLGQRVADQVAEFGGSWPFIGLFFLCLLGWMAVNVLFLLRPFDPYPFILLNLMLSCLAAVQAPVILMSQSRQSEKDRQRAMHDYEVNLKAELEIMELHEKIELLRTQELARILELQQDQIRTLEAMASRGGASS